MKVHKINFIIFSFLLIFLAQESMAQPQRGRFEKLKAEKVAYISNELSLSVKEAQQFWPLYNELNDKIDSIKEEKLIIMHQMRTSYKLEDESALEKLSDQYIELNLEEAVLKKSYHQQFKAILPIRKVMKYYRAEMNFKSVLIDKLREN